MINSLTDLTMQGYAVVIELAKKDCTAEHIRQQLHSAFVKEAERFHDERHSMVLASVECQTYRLLSREAKAGSYRWKAKAVKDGGQITHLDVGMCGSSSLNQIRL
jgi:hypothetical protein